MPPTTFIYALCEPGTRTVRYIGKSNNPGRRLKCHISKSVKTNTYLGNWIRSVLASGKAPELEILDEVPESQWSFWEREYIRVFRALGIHLVNGNGGGEGGHNPTLETRLKMGESQKASWENTPLRKERVSAAIKSVWENPDYKTKTSGAISSARSSPESRARTSLQNSGEKNPNFGKTASEETRAKQSAAKKGGSWSAARRAAHSPSYGKDNPNFGKKRSLETRAKQSVAASHPWSPARRAAFERGRGEGS